MTLAMPAGWGGGAWGGAPWGGGPGGGDLEVVGALAVRENVVRVAFTVAPNFTGILDPRDASSRRRYTVTPVAGTVGADGQPARPVTVASVAQSGVPGAQGTMLDLTVDRPFSPYPAQYTVTANNLWTSDGTPLDPTMATAQFYGVQRERVPAITQNVLRSRDLANPFVASAVDGNLLANALLVAGAFSSDAGGDLALDEGVASIKKWVLRAMITAAGGFPHDPAFGAGTVADIKRLNTAAVRERIAARARAMLTRHPLILRSAVNFTTVKPGFVRMQVLARTVAGAGIKVEQDFQVAF